MINYLHMYRSSFLVSSFTDYNQCLNESNYNISRMFRGIARGYLLREENEGEGVSGMRASTKPPPPTCGFFASMSSKAQPPSPVQ